MKDPTKLITTGRPHARRPHPVNPPVERASTILFPDYESFQAGTLLESYGRHGVSTHRALEEAVTALERGYETRLVSSGLQACNVALIAFLSAGDHALLSDSVYDPTRKFALNFLTRFGVEVEFYDPLAGGDEIRALMRENTKVVFAESPGSQTFEIQDLPAISKAAHEGGASVIVDNTWGAGYFTKPLNLGADVSLQAGTKYLVGHADALIGAITSKHEKAAKKIEKAILQLGINVSADDAYLTLRGMRSMAARLDRHQETGLHLAKWLAKRPEVERVIHPALKGSPGHDLWKRDFTGTSGLFALVLKPASEQKVRTFIDALHLFGIGYSWGGYESLCIPIDPSNHRSVRLWEENGPALRIHAGLEDPGDLTKDLEGAFAAMNRLEE